LKSQGTPSTVGRKRAACGAAYQRAAEREQQPRLRARERQRERNQQREERVHRQHRREIRLATEQQDVAQRDERLLEQAVEIVGRHVRAVDRERVQHGRDQQHQAGRHEERTIDLERAPDEALARGCLVVALCKRVVSDGGREAAEEHEYLGRVAQRIRVQRDARQDAAADVVDDDHEQHQAAEEIELGVAAGPGRRGHRSASRRPPHARLARAAQESG
jgi:hypothetical protein